MIVRKFAAAAALGTAVLAAALGAGNAVAAPLPVTPITTDTPAPGDDPVTGSAALLPLLITGSTNATPGTTPGTGGE